MSRSADEPGDRTQNLPQFHGMLSRMMREGRSFSGNERNKCFLNTGESGRAVGRFADISATSGLDLLDDGRSVVATDWDQDGDLDFWVGNRNAPRIRMLRNDLPQENNFLRVRLVGNGTDTNRDAVGARLEVVSGGKTRRRLVRSLRAGEGFLSQGSKWIHFGLGGLERIEKLVVHWPTSGPGNAVQEFDGVAVNRRYLLTQGEREPEVVRARRETLAVKPSPPEVPPSSSRGRIPLLTTLPLPALPFRSFQGVEHLLKPDEHRSLFVNLWASWCAPCVDELDELVKRRDELEKNGVRVLALCVDGLEDDRSDLGAATSLLERLDFPFPVGLADEGTVRVLQSLHNFLIPRDAPLPVPCSFLIDGRGRLTVIYRGRVSIDEILEDAGRSFDSPHDRFEGISPLSGRSIRRDEVTRSMARSEEQVRFYFSTMLEDVGRVEEAILNYQAILNLVPDSYETHYNLGVLWEKKSDLRQSRYHFAEAIRIRPDSPGPRKRMAELAMRSGQTDEAEEQFRKVVALDPTDAGSLCNYGVLLARSGRSKEAVLRFELAAKVSPGLPQAHYNLGATLASLGLTDRAKSEFEETLALDSAYLGAHFALAAILEQEGDFVGAIAHYRKEVANDPRAAEAHFRLGWLLEKSGNPTEAARSFRSAIEVDPKHLGARAGLERTVPQGG